MIIYGILKKSLKQNIPGPYGRGWTILGDFCVVLIYWLTHGPEDQHSMAFFSPVQAQRKPPSMDNMEYYTTGVG